MTNMTILKKSIYSIQLLSIIILAGCGDDEYQIYGDYYLSDSGGFNKYIIIKEKNSPDKVVISRWVYKYVVKENKIYVAQRIIKSTESKNSIKSFPTEDCEYYVIDVISNELFKYELGTRMIDDLTCGTS